MAGRWRRHPLGALAAAALAVGACGGEASGEISTTAVAGVATTEQSGPGEGCADVIAASIEWEDATATISATVRSADTGWDKYADKWEVRGEGGSVLGERMLTHPHENEQPFTRTLGGVEIPGDIVAVTIAAHDSVAGWCGEVVTIDVPPRP